MNFFPRGIKAAYAVACLLLCMQAVDLRAAPLEQDTVEAAMTLQLLGFTEWPEGVDGQKDGPKTIGIMDSDAALAAFQALLSDSRFNGRYIVQPINADTPNEDLFRCDALFFSEPDPAKIPRIIKRIEDRPIVLIGSFEGFLEEGGLVNLVKRQKRLGFEIQLDNSKRRGIEYRAKLLRLATRIVQE